MEKHEMAEMALAGFEVAAQLKVWSAEKKREKDCDTAQGQLDIKTV